MADFQVFKKIKDNNLIAINLDEIQYISEEYSFTEITLIDGETIEVYEVISEIFGNLDLEKGDKTPFIPIQLSSN